MTGETLSELLRRRVREEGPMDVGSFMTLALAHPEHGYYMTRDPLGVNGDFTTAPEISQMFGELLGAWAADVWAKLGSPARFTLLECGPGRGTLMADALRATACVPAFLNAVSLHLLEISPPLRHSQKKILGAYNPTWHETLDTLPDGAPLIVLANEFFDALPVRQLVRRGQAWQERVITTSAEQDFVFAEQPAPDHLPPLVRFAAKDADIAEISPARIACARRLGTLLQSATGAALIIDYGYREAASGETLQALHRHAPVHALEKIGEADLTAHVDFSALSQAAQSVGASISGPVGQGDFLLRLGLRERAQALLRAADSNQAATIRASFDRLTHPSRMGQLFQVMAFHCGLNAPPEGFI